MTILNVVQAPHSSLNIQSTIVTEFTPEIEAMANDMTETMLANNLVGIASNQVGYLRRIIIVDFGTAENHNPITMVNPKVEHLNAKSKDGKQWNWEACGSIQGKMYLVERTKKIRVTFQNIHGTVVGLALEGEMAFRVQHEVDHLNGVLLNKAGKYRQMQIVK